MFTGQLIGLGIIGAALLLMTAVRPRFSELSQFELKRRQRNGDNTAATELRRQQILGDVVSLQRVKSGLLLVIFVVLSVATLGWLFGTILALFVALEYGALARLPIVSRSANKLYQRYEPVILRTVEKFDFVMKILRTVQLPDDATAINSKAELLHYVERSQGVLSIDEKKLIENSLSFDTKLVSDVMTPRSVIDTVAIKEYLGPLVLDDLHKTGHSRFPVINGSLDHIEGVLHIRDLLTIDAKRKSTSVKSAMEPKVFYIKQEQSLQHALSAFLKTRHHLFIVVNEFRKTVGLVSLEDVIESLIGRKIVDEYDAHEDLRMVAARNPHQNNVDKSSTNV